MARALLSSTMTTMGIWISYFVNPGPMKGVDGHEAPGTRRQPKIGSNLTIGMGTFSPMLTEKGLAVGGQGFRNCGGGAARFRWRGWTEPLCRQCGQELLYHNKWMTGTFTGRDGQGRRRRHGDAGPRRHLAGCQ